MKIKESPYDGGKLWCFQCPACNTMHAVVDHIYGREPGSGWTYNGDPVSPTFGPSVLVYPHAAQPRCHSFVRDGKIEFLSDCTHALAGQTVDLPDIKED